MVKVWVWSIWSLNSKVTMYLRNEQLELPIFLHAGANASTNSLKLKDNWKFLGWVW